MSSKIERLQKKMQTASPSLRKILIREMLKVKATEKRKKRETDLRYAISECRDCSLGGTREQALWWQGPLRDLDVAVITPPPTVLDDRRGYLLAGQHGAIVKDALKRAGSSADRALIIPAVACHPPKDRDPSAKELRACMGHLSAQLEMSSASIGVTLGRVATAAVMGTAKSNVKETPGTPFWVDGRIWVSTFSPQEATADRGKTKQIEEAFQTALALRWGRKVLPIPPHDQIEIEGERGVNFIPLIESRGWVHLNSTTLNCQILIKKTADTMVPPNIRHLPAYTLEELIKVGIAGKGRRAGWTKDALRTLHMVRAEFNGTVIVG